jgi:tetratricopeptide (TPR) repeat protein
VADFTQALKINPNYAKAFHNRGSAYFYQQSYHEALSDYSRAIELDPLYAEAYFNRGSAWLKIGRRDKALTDIRRARQIDPEHPMAERVLALLTSGSAHSPQSAERTGAVRSPKTPDQPEEVPSDPDHEERGVASSPAAARRTAAMTASSKPVAGTEPAASSRAPSPEDSRPNTVQIASFPHPEAAVLLAEELARKGRSACSTPVHLTGKGWWYRVLVGRYPSRTAARTAATDLRSADYPGAFATWKPFAVEVLPDDDTPGQIERLVDELRRRGYVAAPSDRRADRVLVGAFDTRSRARALKEDLKNAGWRCRVVSR